MTRAFLSRPGWPVELQFVVPLPQVGQVGLVRGQRGFPGKQPPRVSPDVVLTPDTELRHRRHAWKRHGGRSASVGKDAARVAQGRCVACSCKGPDAWGKAQRRQSGSRSASPNSIFVLSSKCRTASMLSA